jgi:preprotein translocase subunit SecG
MYNLILILHVLIVIGLLGVILIQRGRSGGLIEALGGVESIFGTKTSSFFVKLTVVLATLFFITSISLAYLSKEKGKSVMEKYKRTQKAQPLKATTQPLTSGETKPKTQSTATTQPAPVSESPTQIPAPTPTPTETPSPDAKK